MGKRNLSNAGDAYLVPHARETLWRAAVLTPRAAVQ
jgi:hypothetical protein